MSKAFFKKVMELTANNVSGRLFMVIENGNEDKALKGQKLFVQGENFYYKDENYKEFWENSLKDIDEKVIEPTTFTLENGVKIFGERLNTKPTLVICGGGHVSLFVYKVALMVGFDVVVIDDREEFANYERFPDAKEVICKSFKETLPNLNYGDDCYYVIVTRGHVGDGVCLEEILKIGSTYVGMIGSRKKVGLVKKDLQEKGFSQEQIASVHTPIGIDINAETPEEISISIMAEIINVRRSTNCESFVNDDALKLIAETDEPVTLSMILEKHGSIPRGAGAKMAVTKSGILAGTIGGGGIEFNAKNESMRIADMDVEPICAMYSMKNEEAREEGMACGGNALLYIEPIK
ncbi:MAG: XdhC/CoxI family protein [Oscillospiraceae bacterium]